MYLFDQSKMRESTGRKLRKNSEKQGRLRYKINNDHIVLAKKYLEEESSSQITIKKLQGYIENAKPEN